MEWKNYIQSLLLIAVCCTTYYIFQNKKITEPTSTMIVQEIIPHKDDETDNETVTNCESFDNEEINHENIDYQNDEDEAEPQHHYFELPKKIFTTIQERKDLFDQLEMEYLDHEVFGYAPAQYVQARLTDMYLEDPEIYEYLSELYKDDVTAKTLIPMSIRWLGQDVGYGIFAEKDIEKDEFIGLYTGSVQDRSLIDNKDYAWFYPVTTQDGGIMSLDGCWQGNELRFINDGTNPNCVVQYVIGNDDLWHICYVACADIKKGEQLLISYGPEYWKTREAYTYHELADKD